MSDFAVKRANIHVDLIFVLFLPLILIGKLVRFTIMKEVLVDTGVGHHVIRYVLAGGAVPEEGPSRILNTLIGFFAYLGLRTYIHQEVLFSIIWNLLVLIMLMKIKKYLSFTQASFLACSIMVLNIFAFTVAKEPIQMLYFVLVYIILINSGLSEKIKFFTVVVAVLFAAFTFRIYFYLIPYFMVVAQIVVSFLSKKKTNVLTAAMLIFISAGVAYAIFLNIAQFLNPEDYAELLRVRTTRGTGRTTITPSVEGSSMVFLSINYVCILVRMLFPLELLPMGVKYFPYVFYQLLITLVFLRNFAKFKENPPTVNLAMIVYFGFLCCSATFEPDFGSWVRHESVVFPVFLVMTEIRPVIEYKRRHIHDTGTAYI